MSMANGTAPRSRPNPDPLTVSHSVIVEMVRVAAVAVDEQVALHQVLTRHGGFVQPHVRDQAARA